MRITFLMPGYPVLSGGYRVVYEYANRLVSRGHQVAVVSPRRLSHFSPEHLTPYRWLGKQARAVRRLLSTPSIDWHSIDRRVELLYVPNSDSERIPDGDILFATGWQTVASVLACPARKGEKCYLIQHYETCMGPKELVDATWRSPLHKVVVSKWLLEIGNGLGSEDLAYIPNAIDHQRYQLIRPIEGRKPRVAMMFSEVPFKGSADGIEAIAIALERHPGLEAVFFGTSPPKRNIPPWIDYHRNPPQDFIVREIYNGSSIFLCPSISEGFALPPAEAAACGCAVVATDNGGIRDFVEDGVTGLLSAPREPKKLAENLSLLLEDDDLRMRLATACNRLVSNLSWKHSTDLMEGFLARVTHSIDSEFRKASGGTVPA